MVRIEAGDQLQEAFHKALELCREGEWNDGLLILGRIAESGRAAKLPGTYYSYLGYAIARLQRRTDEGLKLCRHALKVQFYEPDNYVNLARTALLAKDRREAVRAVLGGLKVDPSNVELAAIYRELGIRQRPVLPFLSRRNPLNWLLGKIRSAVFGPAVRPLDAPPPVVTRRAAEKAPQQRPHI
jgi:tetratricopeptide (TPR) repeat protein